MVPEIFSWRNRVRQKADVPVRQAPRSGECDRRYPAIPDTKIPHAYAAANGTDRSYLVGIVPPAGWRATGPLSQPVLFTADGAPANESGQSLSLVVAGNSNPGLFTAGPTVDAASGDLRYTPAPNAHGVAVVTFVLQDDGGTENDGQDTDTDTPGDWCGDGGLDAIGPTPGRANTHPLAFQLCAGPASLPAMAASR